MQKITPFLWFDASAEEAARFYVDIFKNAKIKAIARYGDAGPGPAGSVMTVTFEIEGQEFIALNGGPMFKFNESISFVVNCKNQNEIDYYWERLLQGGGQTQACGWLKDKFGVAWQIVPISLAEMVSDGSTARANSVIKAMLEMVKLDEAKLRAAYDAAPLQ